MNEQTKRTITRDVETERLLFEIADLDTDGPPPQQLVTRALSAIAEPESACSGVAAAGRRSTALIVLSLAAAGFLMAAISSTQSQLNFDRSTLPWRVASRQSEFKSTRTAMLEPARPAPIAMSRNDTQGIGPVQTPAMPRHLRSVAYQKPLRAVWTDSVVTASEQGVVVPVVTEGSSETEDENTESAGVAVVPIQSGISYIEYKSSD